MEHPACQIMFNWRNFMLAALLAIIIVFQDMLLDDLVVTLFYPIDNRVNGGIRGRVRRQHAQQTFDEASPTIAEDGALQCGV